MDVRKLIWLAATAFVLHLTPAIQQIKAQTSHQLSIDALDTIPAASLSPDDLQVITLDQINKIRASHNKIPLQLDTNLSQIAQNYANEQKFDHNSQDLKTRLENGWYIYTYASENISDLSHAPSATISLAIQEQEHSPIHRKNLLNEKAYYVWVGLCEGILVIIFSRK